MGQCRCHCFAKAVNFPLPVTTWLTLPFASADRWTIPDCFKVMSLSMATDLEMPCLDSFLSATVQYMKQIPAVKQSYSISLSRRHITQFFCVFLYVHTCSWCILLEFFGEVRTAVNNGNSWDTSWIFAQTIDSALRTGEAVNESITPRLVLLLPSYFSSHIIFS